MFGDLKVYHAHVKSASDVLSQREGELLGSSGGYSKDSLKINFPFLEISDWRLEIAHGVLISNR